MAITTKLVDVSTCDATTIPQKYADIINYISGGVEGYKPIKADPNTKTPVPMNYWHYTDGYLFSMTRYNMRLVYAPELSEYLENNTSYLPIVLKVTGRRSGQYPVGITRVLSDDETPIACKAPNWRKVFPLHGGNQVELRRKAFLNDEDIPKRKKEQYSSHVGEAYADLFTTVGISINADAMETLYMNASSFTDSVWYGGWNVYYDTPRVTFDGRYVCKSKGAVTFQACTKAGVEIYLVTSAIYAEYESLCKQCTEEFICKTDGIERAFYGACERGRKFQQS
jgi:hypothetical protein